MKKIKYLNQLLILFPLTILAFFAFFTHDDNVKNVSYINILVEVSLVTLCFFLMFKIEEIKESRRIYELLLVSTSLLVISGVIDVIDELVEISPLFDMLEDTLKPMGSFFFISACYQWVNHHKNQLRFAKRKADIDPLTNLYNRRAFMDVSENFETKFGSNSVETSILVIDADKFKSINDTYGHQFGDKVLIALSKNINKEIRKNDFLARIGGEEFVIVLTNTNSKDALHVAQKIINRINKLELRFSDIVVKCTVSIGVATSLNNTIPFTSLFRKADEALYKAKKNGRNCCILSKNI